MIGWKKHMNRKYHQYLEEIQAAVNDFIKEIWHDEWGKII